jgi:hypothetical protein
MITREQYAALLECLGTGLGLMLTALFFWGFWIATP